MAKRVEQFRIFLSSPGDIEEERDIARKLIKEVLPYSPFIRGRATFDVVSWDDPQAAPGLDARLTPQEAINRQLPKPSECDIVIVILWSRMGTPMPSDYIKKDGSTYQSGTEWEYDSASSSGRTLTLLYRRTEEPRIGLDDPELQEKVEQFNKVKAFFERFHDVDGSLSGSFATYEAVEDFRGLLRQNLESAVSGLLGDMFSEELGVTKAAVDSMMAILKEQKVPPEQLEAKLNEIAERHLELTEKLHQLSKSNDEPEVARRREQAAEAIEQGEYDRADLLLTEAVAIDRIAIDEQQEVLDRRKLSAAATIAQQGELERARLSYRKAAGHFAEAADLIQHIDREAYFSLQIDRARVLLQQGRGFGDNIALTECTEIYRLILSKRPRADVPQHWARVQHLLGIALQVKGTHAGDPNDLQAAVLAFNAALEERTRDRFPLQWANTQDDLGTALTALGERETGTNGLRLAVAAFKAALEERTRDRMPQDWASSQANLGTALSHLGVRESGTEILEAAVVAFKAALEEESRQQVPLRWAHIQSNLGVALMRLGQRRGRIEELLSAVRHFNASLEERTRDCTPFLWARTMTNLGKVLGILGEYSGTRENLVAAIDACEKALEERLRERSPLHWAITQNNLGSALRALGEQDYDTDKLNAAIECFKAALEERTRDRFPLAWAATQQNLGNALHVLGEQTGRRDLFEAALEAIRSAADVVLNDAGHTHRETEFKQRIAAIEAAIAHLS